MRDRFFMEVGVGVISPGLLSQSRVVGCVPSNPKAKESVLCPSVSIRRIWRLELARDAPRLRVVALLPVPPLKLNTLIVSMGIWVEALISI
jgi:hypothetical protein